MADKREDTSREDLTEEASPYRIEEFRRKGMVAQSRELNSLVALIAVGATAYGMSDNISHHLAELMKELFQTNLSAKMNFSDPEVLRTCGKRILNVLTTVGLPVCGAGFVLSALSSGAQVGGVFSFEPLNPDLSKLDPIQGLKRLLSVKQLLDGLRLIVKVVFVLSIVYSILKSEVFSSIGYYHVSLSELPSVFAKSAQTVAFPLIITFIVFAVIDLFMQRYEFSKSLRLTKQEAKQEYKEREGDPQIRARIRSIQREMARRRMMHAVKKADVVVTNPTHIAVALVYEKSTMSAPKVVAKGADYVAQRIKEIAAEANVPLVENVPLARTLYKTVKVGQGIPHNLYQAVAEVLAFVYRLRNRRL